MATDNKEGRLLTRIFARALSRFGVTPESYARVQLVDAINRDDEKTAAQVLQKFPATAMMFAQSEETGRSARLFEIALDKDRGRIVEAMVKHHPSVLTADYSKGEDFINRTILMQRCIISASRQGQDIPFLISSGVDVHAKDDDGNTALHFAGASGQLNAGVDLINAGADVNATNKKGETPLMLAAQGDGWVKMERLINHGKADIHICDAAGLNATMHAIHNHNIKGAQWLMELGGKVLDHNDPAIDRLRSVAAYEGEFEFIRLLNSQYDQHRNRQEELAKLTMKEICEKGTPEALKVKRIRLKEKTP